MNIRVPVWIRSGSRNGEVGGKVTGRFGQKAVMTLSVVVWARSWL
jgi:hypothetical protein